MIREALIERIRAGVLAACDDVSGVILFGSFARGKPAHDVDVLVVVRGSGKPRREWDAQVIKGTKSCCRWIVTKNPKAKRR